MSSKLKELSRNMEIVNQKYVKIQKTLKDYLQKHKEDIWEYNGAVMSDNTRVALEGYLKEL